jgi:receptor expression-enhancing protein 5/6
MEKATAQSLPRSLRAAQEANVSIVMLPATRGAEVLYINVVRPALGNVKSKVQSSSSTTGSNPFQKDGFSAAGTTAPSSFERESLLIL